MVRFLESAHFCWLIHLVRITLDLVVKKTPFISRSKKKGENIYLLCICIHIHFKYGHVIKYKKTTQKKHTKLHPK